jgi:sigma-B regulation protein RsbU (phosphoserine phosphatase)
MDHLRLLIVDDEPLIRAGIRADLSGMESVQVAGECGCVADAVAAIRSRQFDLVLLDVQMPDGAGFDVIREVGPQQMPPVVFVTAYDQYALRAFEVNAVDYLLKPFDSVRLRESIDRVRDRLSRPAQSTRQMEQLIEAHSHLLATVDRQAEDARHAHAEMETARGVQEKLFPREASPVPDIEYAGRCAPARNVGGDYYDFLRFGEGRMGIVLADVSGKGVPAALLMANLQGSFRTHAEGGRCEPLALLRSINRLLYESTSPETFATVFFGAYDCATHRLRYVNCGHPAPYLFRAGGGAAVRLEPTSTVLGAFPAWNSDEIVVELSPGDTLFAYSDGLTEARSANGEEFGDSRLNEVLASARSDKPEAVIDKAIGAVQKFGFGIQEDDMTAVILRRPPGIA